MTSSPAPDTLPGTPMSKAELIDIIARAEASKAIAAADQARATIELLRLETAEFPTWRPERIARSVGTQVALARSDSPRKGTDHLNLAKSLTDALPNTLNLMRQGKLSEHRASIISKETSHLSLADRREVDYDLSGKLTGLGNRTVRDQTRASADRIDPDGAERRVRAARKAGFAASYADADGTARLTTRLPFEKAHAIHRSLQAAAHEARKDKAETRPIGQIMADCLAERVLGGATVVPHIEIQLVMNERTLLRGSDEPAWVPGYGFIPGFLSRALISDSDKVWVRRLYSEPKTGELVAMESKRRIFTPGLRKLIVARDRTCRTAFCNAEIKHIDHRTPRARKGKTTARNGDGLCERCNYAKTDTGLRAEICHPPGGRILELVTPTGHTYESTAPTLPGVGPTNVHETLRRILDDHRPMTRPACEDEENGPAA